MARAPDMGKERKQELPYEETEESFGRWFRETAKEKWQNYLNGNERGVPRDEIDAMRKFLIGHGTKEEVQTKLDSFDLRLLPHQGLLKDLQVQRPNLKLDP